MLDSTTKRKIDSTRQILVGKVPDPKAQVEQITTALVYKFMDDMDKEAEELGGKANFFTDDLKDFAWSRLLDARYSGQEKMDLYVRAIAAFTKAKQLPQLFRDIFKDAFLPYRDPETLSLFLKEIDNFTYDHSEDLGNAFEYLLSVLGSQGDAGQFRTPRHIIDFIIAVVDPKKNETVLDPACGTAGFLISAYKHIRKHNSSNFKPEKEKAKDKLPEGESIAETVLAEKTYRGDQLTPSEKSKLMSNFVGYDISPDMVKLSLVNMYLHGFPEPKITEYDTLASEKHWGDQFDVILANPPFMSPKGGIRPHKRFSVQASRSEVLFVDYILEHLALKGRAGIIVPEGIIFKTENAYKQLRQMLIDDGLFAVVSLPPGVFNPYSGVKTSILLFDNELTKKSDEILFLKIENDGFDLGAQRRKIDKNHLPEALEILESWKQGKKKESDIALWVKKGKIAESGDYNLTGERYREVQIRKNQKWPLVELGEVLDYEQPTKYIVKLVDYNDNYKTPVLTAGKTFILGYTNEKEGIFPADKLPVIIFDDFTTNIKFVDFLFKVKSSAMKILHPDIKKIHPIFAYHLMRGIKFRHEEHKRYWISEYSKIKIPLPPLEVQKEIVEQIEVKQNAINHAKEIIKNLERERRYFGQELRKLENVEWVELGDVCDIKTGKKDVNHSTPDGRYPFFTCAIGRYKSPDYAFDTEAILLPGNGANVGKVFYFEGKFQAYQRTYVLLNFEDKILGKFLYHYLSAEWIDYIQSRQFGSATNYIVLSGLQEFKIPLPPLEIQKQIVAEAEKEEEIITANRRLIELMKKKINNIINQI